MNIENNYKKYITIIEKKKISKEIISKEIISKEIISKEKKIKGLLLKTRHNLNSYLQDYLLNPDKAANKSY